ncbi:MAG: response regulator [Bdellovibrionales bacterium]|nr:response regulator [Bdellovibrionales bacterium]
MKKQSYKILTVGDDECIRSTISDLLEDEGFETVHAKNGRVALDYLLATPDERLPNLIFLDYMMPVMDGESFCLNKAANPRLANIPVVMMTASGNLIRLMDTVEKKASGFMSKPMEIDVVMDMVEYFQKSKF